jgi:hypothetical protein
MKTTFLKNSLAVLGFASAVMFLGTTTAHAQSVSSQSADTATSTTASDLQHKSVDASTSTTASDLDTETVTSQATPAGQETGETRIAQTTLDPGRETRSGPSYIGVGGNIGFGGDSALGRGNFTVISKIGLIDTLSARPSMVIGDDPAILVPLTVDFPISSVLETGEVNLEAAPYVGGGIVVSTGSDSTVRPLATAGVDVPVTDQITANAAVNAAFFDDTEFGIVLCVGYNF